MHPQLGFSNTMQLARLHKTTIIWLGVWLFAATANADDFTRFVQPLLAKKCAKCHGVKKANAEINFRAIQSSKDFLAKPKLIQKMLRVIGSNDMPPETEPQLNAKDRTQLLAALKSLLRQATAKQKSASVPIHRLNRFQYNNTVVDLFQLKRNVFHLPEKLMTRRRNYLLNKSEKMPRQVQVACESLKTTGGFRNVKVFPKDLRASHGFDNQANQMTLSPLLLDLFLRLSVSIVESPDFNAKTVGIWNDFFAEPKNVKNKPAAVKRRLRPFLTIAFRRPVDDATLARYSAYAVAQMKRSGSFTTGMKKVASAAMSSPLFLLRAKKTGPKAAEYAMASNLSYALWGSCPDAALLKLAETGELSKPAVLKKTIDRMLADPKVERFLDAFPRQWMQLQNVLGATPDPKLVPFYRIDRQHNAGTQMVLEPLLLFDAVFIENRPLTELISPSFTYRSEFLKDWYQSKLTPPRVDVAGIKAENKRNEQRRQELQSQISDSRKQLNKLLDDARKRVLAKRKKTDKSKPVDLKPYAAWEFNSDLKESIRGLDLKAHGKVGFNNGSVVLKRSYLLSKKLPIDLRVKTLEVWCKVHNLNQRGGGVMGIQGPGDFFDTIVLGERKPRHWISGSNHFARTKDFPKSQPETKTNQMLHLVMVYESDGTTRMYRDGQPYGGPFRKGRATFPKNRTSVIFGLRHLPAGGNKYLNVSIDKARLYDRALSAKEVAAAFNGADYVTKTELAAALSPAQKKTRNELAKSIAKYEAALKKVPQSKNPRRLQQQARQRFVNKLWGLMKSESFERIPVKDPKYGGVITNAALLTMTSGPKRTHPIARGAWIVETIFNDPPPPPPNNVPPLKDDGSQKNLTIRERFAAHRKHASCAGCHSRIDPLGFALENYDIVGRWRDRYDNGRKVDIAGKLFRRYPFDDIVKFKSTLVKEKRRFAKAFAGHLMRYAAARELIPADSLLLDDVVEKTKQDDYRLRLLIREVMLRAFRPG